MRKQLRAAIAFTLASAMNAAMTACGGQQPTGLGVSKTSATTTTVANREDNGNMTKATTIVLVHGAWADASGWYDVTRILQDAGYNVVAVQNSLFSFAKDIETTKRVIDAQQGPLVVVGHSYGGAVMTAAASGNANVTALVYVAAFAPDAGEPIGALLQKYPDLGLGSALRPDAAGFLYIDPAKYGEVFANGLPDKQARAFAIAQKPIAGSALGEPLATAPAWKSVPSWFVVATEDHAINPELERFMAKRMNAQVTEVRAGHLVFISRAPDVAHVIETAAK